MLRKILAATLLILLTSTITACRVVILPPGPGTPSANDLVNTAAAQTVSALGTEIATGRTGTRVAPKNTLSMPTLTLTPNLTPIVTVVTPTPTPTPGLNCNQASFVRDITIPDGSTILPNSTFTKTWELKNTGSCAWDSSYAVVFAGRGNAMSGPASTPLIREGQVKPGETALVSVALRAPGEPGEYEGYWSFRSGNNQLFGIGIGQNASAPFYLKIRVASEYSFAEHLCSAKWSSGAGDLPCPGKEGDSQGYILPVKNPTLEDNKQREGLGWLAVPQAVAGGYIVGTFPAVIVPEQSDFRTTLSCAPGADGCYIHLKVTYRIDNGAEQVLGEWNEGYEGGITEAVADLDAAAGRSTVFSFYVYVSSTPSQGKGLWFFPRILRN